MRHPDLSLYLVTDRGLSPDRPLEEVVEEAVLGGVVIVQLREKNTGNREFYELAVKLKRVLSKHHVPLIINDRLDIALAADAEGVHLGQTDLALSISRKILGPEKIIGLSVETLQQAYDANETDADYIAISPVFSTPTKTDTRQPFGIKGVKEVSSISKFPAVAIGGINADNAGEVIRNGAAGIAVVSAIMAAASPLQAAAELKKIIDKAKRNEAE